MTDAPEKEWTEQELIEADNRIRAVSSLAGEILRDMACLGAEGISESLYDENPPQKLERALSLLAQELLIRRLPEAKRFTTSPKLQRLIRDTFDG